MNFSTQFKDISFKKNQEHIGETHDILIEGQGTSRSLHNFQGRTDGNKLVILPQGRYQLGQLIRARITEATPHVLKGEAIISKT